MAAGLRNNIHSSNTRTVDKNLEDSQSTGSLDLSSRKLSDFPRTAESYDLADTVEANLSKNRFCEIPEEVCQFVLLERLNCYHNAIRALPDAIIRLQYLGFLNLSRNQLSVLPPFLSQLKCLEVLIVSHNRLVSIPEEISQLGLLMELDVSNNEISMVPSQIGDLGELKILNLRKNLLLELPPEISRLKLKSLDFSCNKIQTVPLEYRFMETLEELVLENNPLVNPPASTCTKGRVHILKYLHILAVKEDKRRGVLSETGFNRNTLRRSYQKEDAEAVRLRRKAIHSTDSGYITDTLHRWTTGGTENGFDGAIKAAESLKEQRAERHLELQKRICNAELVSPSRPPAALSPCSPDRGDGGSISPLKFTPGGTDNGEDMFARELQKQKYDYEQRKKKAEQAKFEGGVRKPSRVHTASPVVPGSAPVGQLPQPPVRSASVNVGNSSSILHGYNNGSVLKNPSLFSHHYFHPKQEGVESELKHTFEQNLDRSTDSHRSSPSSLTSQESDHRVSSLSSRVSSGTPEPHITSKPPLAHSTQDNSTHKLPTRNSHKSAAAAPKDSVDAAVSRHTPTKVSSAVGFQSAGSLGRGVKLPSRPVNGNEHSTADSSPQSGKSSTKPVGEASHISDIKEIIESRLKVTLPKDVMGELKDGVILCHLANHIKPRTVSQIHVKSSAVPKLTMAKCKRNVENFLEACRRLGVPQEQLCSQADIIDEKRPAPLLCTLQALVDLKTALAKSATCAQTAPNSVHSRPNSRSKSSQPGPSSRSLSNRTTSSSGKQRSHPPLHSVV